MNTTKLIGKLFASRQCFLEEAYVSRPEELQRDVLRRLVSCAAGTAWGLQHRYDTIRTYEDYARQVPVQTYDDVKAYVNRMRHGEHNLLWPGHVRWYAKSSGTTNDKSKFIPVSSDILHDTHYAGGRDCVASYLMNNPDSHFFSGKGLILGGSHAPNYNVKGSLVGDLSAILIENISPLVNLIRVPRKEIALLADFEQKRDLIARSTLHAHVTNLSGVPSWMLSVLHRVLELSGKSSLDQVWPDLEVFFHGGVAFAPYREQYKQLIRSDRMHYVETYNASEGFFGVQTDPSTSSMTLMVDYGVFYEFMPMDEFGKPDATVVPLDGVELGRNYAMLISTSGGLWRYMLGDTVRFTHTHPYKFVITGRTKHFINAFGEELIVDNAEKGLEAACAATGAQVADYTAAPVFMDARARCRHQWLVEFAVMPDSVEHFARVLDEALQRVNSDYEAKRHKDITLQPLELIVARPGLFHDWLKEKGKLGGQHKVPRLSNTREYMDELLRLNQPT